MATIGAGVELRKAIDSEDTLDAAMEQWDAIIVAAPKRAPRPAFKVRPIVTLEPDEPAVEADDEAVD